MNLQNWINEARAHWKERSPKLFKELQKAGLLEERLRDAAERTNTEMDDLRKQGFNEQEAWEITREKYLFTPEESPPKDEEPSSAAPKLSIEANDLHDKLLAMHHATE